MVLHADELGPSPFFGQGIHLSHLVGIGIGYSYVARLPLANCLVHSLQDFLGRCLIVPDVVDVQVHIVHAQVLQTTVYVVQHMLPAVHPLLDFLLRARQELGGHHHLFPSGHIPQGTSHELFRSAQLVGNGRIEEVHS